MELNPIYMPQKREKANQRKEQRKGRDKRSNGKIREREEENIQEAQ